MPQQFPRPEIINAIIFHNELYSELGWAPWGIKSDVFLNPPDVSRRTRKVFYTLGADAPQLAVTTVPGNRLIRERDLPTAPFADNLVVYWEYNLIRDRLAAISTVQYVNANSVRYSPLGYLLLQESSTVTFGIDPVVMMGSASRFSGEFWDITIQVNPFFPNAPLVFKVLPQTSKRRFGRRKSSKADRKRRYKAYYNRKVLGLHHRWVK